MLSLERCAVILAGVTVCAAIPGAGAATVSMDPAAWRPSEQPALAEQFAKAEHLALEDVCEGPDTCWTGPVWWIPNPDGKSHDVVLFYYPEYMGPHEVIIHDFGTGETKRQTIPNPAADGLRHMFHLTPTWLIDGKLVCRTVTSGGTGYWVYDPEKNHLKLGEKVGNGELTSDGGWAFADNGTIYGLGRVKKEGSLLCYKIDTKTWTYTQVSKAPIPAQKNFAGIYASYATQGDWFYAALGNTPWTLYAFNVKDGSAKVIARSDNIVGDYKTMHLQQEGDFTAVRLTTDKGFAGIGGPGTYWVVGDKVLKGNGDAPPDRVGKRENGAGRVKFLGNNDHKPPADIQFHRMPINSDGTVYCWYKLKGAALETARGWGNEKTLAGEWSNYNFKVKFYPSEIGRLASFPDGRIFLVGSGYGRAALYDPARNERTLLGQTISIYSMQSREDKLYLFGYPSTQFCVYDPAKPWTLGLTDPTVPPIGQTPNDEEGVTASAESNPAHVVTLKEFCHVHIPLAGVAFAGGKIFGGGKVIRIGNGGGLGWWDVEKKEPGGLYKEFMNQQPFWICDAMDRYVVISTKPVSSESSPAPERGHLFVYDAREGKLVHDVDAPAWDVPGYVCEAVPGLVMGFGKAKGKEDSEGLLYGFDPAAGKVLWTKPLPVGPITGFSLIRRGSYHFGKGPDGMIWATLGGLLCRIKPENAEVNVLGRLGDGQICFSGGRVYVAGGNRLRRIVGLTVPDQGKDSR